MLFSEKSYPLSQTELGIYLACQTPTLAYNLPHAVEIPPETDTESFREAVRRFFTLHPSFGSRLYEAEDGSIRRRETAEEPEIPEMTVSSLKEIPVTPFTMLEAPLYHMAIVKIGEKRYFYFDVHHILMDGRTLGLFMSQVFSFLEGKEAEPERFTAGEFAEREAARRESAEYEAAREVYRSLYGGIENSPELPYDKKEETLRHAMLRCRLETRPSQLRPFIKELGVRNSAFFLSAFAWLLAKMNMEKEALLSTVYNGRVPELAETAGMFVKTLPFYAAFKDGDAVADYLKAASAQLDKAIANDLYSFADLSRELGVSGDILFAYQGENMFRTSFRGKEIPVIHLEIPEGKGLMSAELHKMGEEYEIWFEYRADLYREETVRQIISLYDRTLREFTLRRTLGEVDLTDEAQLALLEEANKTDLSMLDPEHTVLDYFYRNLEKDPAHMLVVFKDRRFSYAEAEAVTNRIAARLKSWGAGREDVVSVLIPKCEYTMLASLGVLKSGAAYQPLDPTYPRERLNFMVKDAGAKALILDRSLDGLIDSFDGPRLYLDEIESLPDAPRPADRPRPEDLFIMLYTSGTTGQPKGVMLEHGNILSFCLVNNRLYGEDASSRMSAYASYGFDADMMDLYPAVTAGGTVYIIPEEMRLDLMALGDYFNENGITHSIITTQVGRQFAEAVELKTLKHLFVGGERLVPIDPPKGYVFHNAYGPTEGTVFCCEQPVTRRFYSVPIGRHLPDYKFYVLDEAGRRLPWGVKGELCIAGPQVGRGYLNRPEENKKAFLKNPFETEKAFERLYRTGDVVRFLKDGTVDFIGRSDGQVKIRGFRVELSEVEQIVRRFPGIKDATVKDFTDPAGVKYIAAYVVSDEPVDIDGLCAFIGRNKPPYMIPACIMQIDKIPLTQNQKVNKRALPEPQPRVLEIVPPATETESRVFEIVSGILGHASFGVTTDIYEAGLTSVSSIRLAVQLSKAFSRPFKNSELSANPTVRALAALTAESTEERDYSLRKTYPLTKTQEGIFVECMAKPGSAVYNIPYLFTFGKEADPERLAEAVKTALKAHPYMMSIIDLEESGDVVVVRKDYEPLVPVIDGELPPDDKLIRPFPLLNSNLYRAEVYNGAKSVSLFLDFHHIFCDGGSEEILIRDISAAYEGKTPAAETYSGYEIAVDEEAERKSPRFAEAKAWFESLLAGTETDFRMKKALKTGEAALRSSEHHVTLSRSRLEAFAERNGLSMNAVFNFVFGFVLSKYLYKDEALFTTIYNGRSDSRTQNTVSMLVKTMPVLLKYEDTSPIVPLIRGLRRQIESSQNHDIFSFAEIAETYGVKADNLFVYHGASFRFDGIGGMRAESRVLEADTPKSAFTLGVFPENDGFLFRFEYDGSLYTEETADAFCRFFVRILEQLESVRITGDLDLLSEKDKADYARFNDTAVPLPKVSFNKLFEAQAARVPEKKAIIAPDGEYTYRELNEAANRIAHGLLARGVGSGKTAVVLMPRQRDAYAARQGVIKSGAAFVPVDPKYPDERVSYIIEESGASAVITTKELKAARTSLLSGVKAAVLEIEDLLSGGRSDNPDVAISPEALCYVIFTSGSTGKPKGVMIRHRNLVNLCLDGKNRTTAVYRAAGDPDVISCSFASLSFDASVQEECVPLSHGYTAVMAGENEIENPLLLADLFLRNGVTLTFLTPSYVANAVEVDRFLEAIRNLKVLIMAAETMPAELIEKLWSAGVKTEIYNGYGPTEVTVASTYGHITDRYITIGGPVGNTKLWLLDPHGHILPIGAIGDLTMTGDSVGVGYLHLPDKTAERFITVNGEPAFRSGDMARYNSEGNVEFFGRMDNQVKLRGLRVELDEIEKAITAYVGIAAAVVTVRNNAAEGDYLAAYFTAKEAVDKADLTAFIGRSLTPYMIPKVMMQLDKMPLTPNGKVDKKALPEPEEPEEKTDRKLPRTELEKKIAALFSRALGVKEVGVDENFFDRGGTSLSVSKVAMLAVGAGLPIAYSDVFDNPTVESLAIHVRAVSGQAEEKKGEEEEAVGEEALRYNTDAYLDEIRAERPLGRVLLTGATGFLGIHVMRELLRQEVPVLALVRGSKELDAETRMKAMLMYYFDSPLDEEVERLVRVCDGDVTSAGLEEMLKDESFDTVINCAACVKHFAADDIIERVNVEGLKNMLRIAKAHGARLIQISTLSVAGENVDGKFEDSFRLFENRLAVGQDISNKYVHSKYMGEKAVMAAIEEGMDAKIVRVGNLMGRQSDGEFQINSVTNGFIRDLKGYQALGLFPVSGCDGQVDFSPIDEVAKVVLLLAKTPKKFTLFHAANSHPVEMGDIIEAMNHAGFSIGIVPAAEFNSALGAMMQDDEKNMLVSSLISYASSDQKLHQFIRTDNRFSVRALYRLGYKWPITDEKYLVNVIGALKSLDFFSRGDI